jgi:4-hydroxy-L-threonine phosphate dehydrogenase PdxA
MRNFIITTGDRDGVGLEVTVKALALLGPKRGSRLLLAAHNESRASVRPQNWTKLRRKWKVVEAHGGRLEDVLPKFHSLQSDELLIFFDSSPAASAEAAWVQTAAKAALKNQIHGLITGPVSKSRFLANNKKDMGHTGLLSRLAKAPVYQGYIGPKLAVLLATDHVELRKVQRALTKKRLGGAFRAAVELQSMLTARLARRPIAVLGLNPHAGENGAIGQFERTWLRLPKSFTGPLPADTAFQSVGLDRYSVVLAMYHDQGLIPFKMLHGQDSGFQISLGLPFIRTSVDHGTAKDLYSKDRANPGSMRDAIAAALRTKNFI